MDANLFISLILNWAIFKTQHLPTRTSNSTCNPHHIIACAVGNNMKNRTSRRIAPSSAYIGAGNKTSSFTHKPKKAFGTIADVYRRELRRKGTLDYRKTFKRLSEAEKLAIKNRIIVKRRKQDWIKFTIAIILLIAICTAGIILLN